MTTKEKAALLPGKSGTANNNISPPHDSTKPAQGGNGNGRTGNGANPEAARAALEALRNALPRELLGKFDTQYESLITQALGSGIDPKLGDLLPPLRLVAADLIQSTEYKPPIWVIEDVLPAGLLSLAGRPKVGKSWLGLQICRSVATGSKLFGKVVERGRALYLALEDNEPRIQRRMRIQHWPEKPRGIYYMFPDAFRSQIQQLNGGGGERLARRIEQEGFRFVVIDTFSRAFRGDQKDESDMTAALSPLQETALKLGIGIMVIDHHKKPSYADDPNPVDDILGSTAKGGIYDAIWGLYAKSGVAGANLCMTGRDIERNTLKLSFDENFCWQSEGEAYAIELTEQRKKILDALKMLGRVQLAAIVRAVGENEGNTFKRLQDLVNAGLVRRVVEGANVFYILPGQPEQLGL